ncbi:sulfocyanin [Acidianus manzaensis]|uniref:Sulfocyanin n=1 Tax=Acidianus manzaensis TaxID=282676 RepID=A0A1W6JYF4_9CREN|nr:sulfocyanin [Acidianus manzaensis]ARM75277.1 sulfocyanin [Acidianus manzaensis]
MSRIGLAILVLIFAGTAFMIGFLAYNFAIVYNPVHYPKAAPLLSNISITSTTHTTTTTTTTTPGLPSGAVALPYDASNHTVFLNIVSLSTGNPFNFNGTSGGQLHIYIPAGWTVIVTYTNQESIPHNFNIVQNSTTTPNNANIGADGKIIFSVGTTSSTYETNGISSGASASGSTSLPAGIYWFACGIAGHAESGMWGVIISSTSITTPYETS